MRFSRYTLLVVFCSFTVLGCFGDSMITAGGEVLDEEGEPISGVTVTLMPAGQSDPRFPPDSHPSGGIGQFGTVIPNYEYGCNQPKLPDFVLRFEKDGYITKTVPCPGEGSPNITVTLSRDKKDTKDSKVAPGTGESADPKGPKETRKAK